MRKLYSLFLLFALATFAMTAAAKTINVEVDNSANIAKMFATSNSSTFVQFTDNKGTLTIGDSEYEYVYVETNSGANLQDVTSDGRTLDQWGDLPATSFQFNAGRLADGATVVITTGVTTVAGGSKIFTFTGGNELMYASVSGASLMWNGNGWEAELTEVWDNVELFDSESPKEKIRRVVADNGLEYTKSNGCVTVPGSDFEGDMHFTVETFDPEETRKAEFTVKVNGAAASVEMAYGDGGKVVLDEDGETTVKFDPEYDTRFTVKHASFWSKSLYKVVLDGEPLSISSDYTIFFTPKPGSVLEITVDAPVVACPMSFKFTNEGTEDVIKSVSVNYQNQSNWNEPGFTVNLGQSVSLDLNCDKYQISEIKLNGEPQSYGGYPYFGFTVNQEGENVLEITATKNQGKKVTIICENYLGAAYMIGYSQPTVLRQEETEVELFGSQTLSIKASSSDWSIDAIVDANDETKTYREGEGITVEDGMMLVVEAVPYVRDKTFTAYVEDAEWSYFNVQLSYNDYSHAKVLSFAEGNIAAGYNTIEYCDKDVPIGFSCYPQLYLYHNDVEISPSYIFNGPMEQGDVLKLFCNKPESHSLTYTLGENVNVSVTHDRSRVIDNPSAHTVLHGTEVCIRQGAANALDGEDMHLIVKVDDTELTPEADGSFVFTVNGDSNVSVTMGSSSVADIETEADNAEAPVYNLQGIRVARAADLQSLPAGLYIVNGKKIRK